jgi:putative heme utilization carrier protein HutX
MNNQAAHIQLENSLTFLDDNSLRLLQQTLAAAPEMMPAQVAKDHNVSELKVVAAMSKEQACFLPLDQKDELLASLPSWGNMTTIIAVSGSIFEFKGSFPAGKYAHGYYNLYTKGDGLHGHLLMDSISHIALISRPFRGQESYSINFFGAQGEMVFKVYLGRDKQRVLIASQVEQFKAFIAAHQH